MGRKRKFSKKVVKIAEEMFLQGATNKEVYEALKISESTFYEWMNTHSEFSEAREKANKINVQRVEDSLLKRATGYTVEETVVEVKTDLEGREKPTAVRKTKKHVAPDVGAMCFFLKNKDPENWKDRSEVLTPDIGGVVLNVNGEKTAEVKPKEEKDGKKKPGKGK